MRKVPRKYLERTKKVPGYARSTMKKASIPPQESQMNGNTHTMRPSSHSYWERCGKVLAKYRSINGKVTEKFWKSNVKIPRK